jgi:hypothetical protein
MNAPLLFFIALVFILGLFFYLKKTDDIVEGLTNSESNPDPTKRCPNLLIQKGSRFYLHNTKLSPVPGVNPIVFEDIGQYSEFMKWQHSVGIKCPVLFLQHMNDAQGEDVYKIRPSVVEPQYGLGSAPVLKPAPTTLLTDAGRNDYPYNTNSYPAYDPEGQNIGQSTPLDTMDSNDPYQLNRTDSAMSSDFDPVVAQKHIDQGVYKDNEIAIRIT